MFANCFVVLTTVCKPRLISDVTAAEIILAYLCHTLTYVVPLNLKGLLSGSSFSLPVTQAFTRVLSFTHFFL